MSTDPELPQVRRIPLALIDPPSVDMRQGMDADALDELARDIRARGVRSPIELLEQGDRFEIIAGHRRYVASDRVGKMDIPAFVYTTPPDGALVARYKENMLREDVEPAAEAIYLGKILDAECDGDTDVLAERVGRSRLHVERRITLLWGHPDVFEALAKKQIGVMIAEELNRCDDPKEVAYLLYETIRGGATRAIVRGWVDQWKQHTAAPLPSSAPSGGAAEGSPVLLDDYFTCYACGSTENKSRMRPVNVHDYCALAWLKPLIDAYNRGEIRLPKGAPNVKEG